MTGGRSRTFSAIFGLMLLLGFVGVGFAGVQIYQMRTSAGNQVLPALAPLDDEVSSKVGHYVRSVFPGISDNSVLAGQFTYMVTKFRIVSAELIQTQLTEYLR